MPLPFNKKCRTGIWSKTFRVFYEFFDFESLGLDHLKRFGEVGKDICLILR